MILGGRGTKMKRTVTGNTTNQLKKVTVTDF
jgi:hypothetical protein